MAIADDLLTLAGHLSTPANTDPEQAWLRRSVSTAYYALFQLLVQEAAQRWTGSLASQLGLERTLKHERRFDRFLERVEFSATRGAPGTAGHCQIFHRFAGGRHQADYNNEKRWTQTEVAAKVSDARIAFQNCNKINGSPVAVEYLLSLMVGKKRE